MVESQKIPGVDLWATTEPQVVRVIVKAPWQKEEFLVHQDMPVREFKEHVGRRFSSSSDRVVLVHGGRILKDHKTLGQHRIHRDEGATIYVILRSHQVPPSREDFAALAHPTWDQKSPPSSTSASDGLWELTASLGLNTANFAEFQTRLMSCPDLMLHLLENPVIQSKLSSPDLVKELVTDNPQVQQVIQKAPQIGHVFSSPEGMKLMVELAQNPAAVREILKPSLQASSFPSGDNNGSLQGPFLGTQGLLHKGLPKKLLASCSRGHPSPYLYEKLSAKEQSLSTDVQLPGQDALNVAAGSSDQSHGESSATKEETGPLVSPTVKDLLHQIIRHLLGSIARSPGRSSIGQGLSHTPERIQMNVTVPRSFPEQTAAHTPAPLQQVQSTVGFWAHWSPQEMQGLLEIQQRLQALATDEPAGQLPRAERPVQRRAHSSTSLCGAASTASREGYHQALSAQSIQQALVGADWAASAKPVTSLWGSSAQPSSKQQQMYML